MDIGQYIGITVMCAMLAALVISLIIPFPWWLGNMLRFRHINKKLLPHGLRARVGIGRYITLEGYIEGSWTYMALLFPIQKLTWRKRSAIRYKAGCFYGDLASLRWRLYSHWRKEAVIIFRLIELESLGVDVSDWPKDYNEHWSNLASGWKDPPKQQLREGGV